MFAIVGILVVFGAVVGGYLMEKGNIMVLLQPAELLIIGGAALGTIFVANSPTVLKGMLGASCRFSAHPNLVKAVTWTHSRQCSTSCKRHARRG